jgi:hypothetical protein
MIRLKYLGGKGAEYQNHLVTIPIGGEADLPDEIALALLKDDPRSFERVGEIRKADAPAANRMKAAPGQNRSKT